MPRKTKPGKRTPSGRLSRARGALSPKGDARSVALMQPHRRWLPEDKRADHRAGTLLGRMYLGGMISEEQYEAGDIWAGIVFRMLSALCAPRSAASIAGIMVPSGNEPPMEVGPPDTRTEEERHEEAMQRYHAILGRLSPDELCALDVVVVRDRCPVGFDMQVLHEALDRLAAVWGIGKKSRDAA